MMILSNYSVGLRGVCLSEARALAALTVRKPGIASKNPIAEGDSEWILHVTVKVLNSYHNKKQFAHRVFLLFMQIVSLVFTRCG